MHGEGYSIWLMPDIEDDVAYNDEIQTLAFGYEAPNFESHITVIGGVKEEERRIVEAIDSIAKDQRAFMVHFLGIETEDVWNRAVYLRARKDEELQSLHERTAQSLGIEPSPDYMPHMSMVYGDFDANQKAEMIQRLGISWSRDCLMSSLALFRTDGHPKKWKRVHEVKFSTEN